MDSDIDIGAYRVILAYSLHVKALTHIPMDNIRVHLLKSGMIVDKITIALLVICLIIVILYLTFHSAKSEPLIDTTTTTISTPSKKKYFYCN